MIAHATTATPPSILGPNGQPMQASGYDALEPRGRRRLPATVTKSEDLILKPHDRRKLESNTQDLRRNFGLVAWAIRQHLNYVSSFRWQATTDDAGLNDTLEAWMADVSRPAAFDASGRHSLHRSLRIYEASRVVGGDVFALKQNDGTLQAIEGDRVAAPTGGQMPRGYKRDRFTNGIETDRRGRPINVVVCNRSGNSLVDARVLPAQFFWQIGYYDRFDQVRGVSPLASAVNMYRDVYEGMEYALALAKVQQMIALVITRNADEAMGDLTGGTDADGNEDKSSYKVDFGRGPQVLDLDPGDDAKFMNGQGPHGNFREFEQFATMVALKSLDIPYSFFDENHGKFHSSRGGLMHYLKSCESKQEDLREFLHGWTMWRMATAIRDRTLDIGSRELLEVAGEWRAVGVPWWDPSKEIDGHLKSIAAGLDNPQRIARTATGTDYFENLELRAQAEERARELGLTVSWTASNQQAIGTMTEGDDTDE